MGDFAARLADIDLTILRDPKPEFWGEDGDGRRVAFTVSVSDLAKDSKNALVSLMNERLAAPCDLVVQSRNSSHPVALRLLGAGTAKPVDDSMWENTQDGRIIVESPCAIRAKPANRFFLASPIGDEWPTSDDVVRDDEDLVFADASRWRIDAVNGTSGTLSLYGDVDEGEVYIVDLILDFEQDAATSFDAQLSWLDSGDSQVGDAKTLLSATSTGRARRTWLLRAPAGAVRTQLDVAHDTPTGDCVGYLEYATLGVLHPSCAINPPFCPQAGPSGWWACETALPTEHWTWESPSGATWSWPGSYYAQIAAVALAADARFQSIDFHEVKPGRTYGFYADSQVTAFTDGTVELGVWWYDEDLNLLDFTDLDTRTAADGSPVLTIEEAEAPHKATWARPGFYVASGSDLTFKARSILFGPVVETPGVVALDQTCGESRVPLIVFGDVDLESDAHSIRYAIGPDDGKVYDFEAEALSWSGGTTATTTSADDYPGTGDTGKKNTGATRATATIDVSDLPRGTYELLVRARTNNASYEATLDCDESSQEATTVETTPQWLSLGRVSIPNQRARPGAATTITVGMVSDNASGYVQVDRYRLVPMTLGGFVSVDPSGAATDYSSIDLEGGLIFLDEVIDLTDVVPGRLLASADDALHVVAEKASSDEITHAAAVVPLHVPEFSLWR